MTNIKNKNIFYILILIIVILLSLIITKYADIFCDLECNQTKMSNIENCTRDMYNSYGRGFTEKQKNDYMRVCIRSYEQEEMKEKLKRRNKKD
jgi:hypothetical protein